jgi:ApeA N-terminal domain 1
MKKYRVDGNFEMIGGFWKYDKPDDKFTGTLSSRNGLVEILTAPIYSDLDDDGLRNSMEKSINDGPSLRTIPAICGFTEDNRCTLLRCLTMPGGGVTDFSTRQEVSAIRYRALRTVMGLHLESADAQSIDGGAFYLTKVRHLLPTPWTAKMEVGKTTYVVPTELKKVFSFQSVEMNAEVTCEVYAGGTSKIKKGAWIRSVPRIKVKPKHPQSVDWFVSIALRVENFFTLFLGTSVELKHVRLFQSDNDGWVVQTVRRSVEKVNFQTWVQCPFPMVEVALQKWLAVPEDKRPVELTLLAIMRKSDVFDETRFLSLAQALEGFGRIRFFSGRGKSPSFEKLIEQTYDLLGAAFAVQLLGEKGEFITKLLQTRNYYTHLGSRRGRSATKTPKELFLFNHRLQAFLRCVMLIDLGVPEDYLKEPILYQATRWR